jgi:AraC-like DNA-binding protein
VDVIYNAKETFQNFLPNHLYLCLITNGFATLTINNDKYFIGCNVLLIVDSSQKLELLTAYELKAKSLIIHSDLAEIYWNKKILVLPTDKFHLKRFKSLFQFLVNKDSTEVQKEKYISELFNIVKDQRNVLGEYSSIETTLMSRIRVYIEENLNRDLCIKTICDIFYMNRTALNKQFKEYAGVTVSKYIMDKRISRAKYNLEKTNMSMKDITQAVGYQDQASFTKMFKSVTGLSPLKYRIKYSNPNKLLNTVIIFLLILFSYYDFI